MNRAFIRGDTTMTKLHESTELMSASLGEYEEIADAALARLGGQNLVGRIWQHDHTVWKPDPADITNRLGWLNIAETMRENIGRLEGLADAVRADGYTHALLMGMGGSSLAPEVFSKTFGAADGYLRLGVLDSTDPGTVLARDAELDMTKTLFIVSTKSGGTAETLSFFKYFYNRVAEAAGPDEAGQHFIAITDPGSKLAELAERHRFRATFINDPDIGGRYSALSYFGLAPAALLGIDLARLLDRAMQAACDADACKRPVEGGNNAARLGAIMGSLANVGRDKVTFVTSAVVSSFGDWVEQLIAESTGKQGRGILPVVGQTPGEPDAYGEDRLFVHLRIKGDETDDRAVQALADAGYPVVTLGLRDSYDLGYQIFLWEMATVIAGALIDINPFDQPNVEAAKVQARQMVAAYQENGQLPELEPALQGEGMAVFGDVAAETVAEALNAFLGTAGSGAYVAVQAYVEPTPETDAALLALRTGIRELTSLAVTTGYGPRFLHSTGQLHKGDAGNGLFIQLTSSNSNDVGIPDEAGCPDSSVTFGILESAQALGDRQALLDNGRAVIRIDLGTGVDDGLQKLTAMLQ